MSEGILAAFGAMVFLSVYLKIYFHIKAIKHRRNLAFHGIREMFNLISLDTIIAYFSWFLPVRPTSRAYRIANIFWVMIIVSFALVFWGVGLMQQQSGG